MKSVMFPYDEEAVEDIESYLDETFVENSVEEDNMSNEEAGFVKGWKEAFE